MNLSTVNSYLQIATWSKIYPEEIFYRWRGRGSSGISQRRDQAENIQSRAFMKEDTGFITVFATVPGIDSEKTASMLIEAQRSP